jgi:hypothetical protein
LNKFAIKFAAFAAALLCAGVVSAKTNTLDGNGFTLKYTGSTSALSLSADGSSIVFNDLSAGWFSSASESGKLTLTLDSGYSFSSLLVSAAGTYSGLISTSSATLTSSVKSSGLSTLSDRQTTSKSSFFSGSSWALSKTYDLASTSFATASALNVSSSLALSSSGLGTITAQSYTVTVATAPIVVVTPTLPSVPTVPTVPAVPEPGEWAMMLAGLGMIGTIAMRRARQD